MNDIAELHDKAWATRGSAKPPVEDPSPEPEPGLRRYRPGKQEELPEELIRRYEAARAAMVQRDEGASVLLARTTDEILGYTTYEDTKTLIRGEKVTVTATPNPPWEVGERLQIVDEGWRPACIAVVIEALPDDQYILEGESPSSSGP